MSALIAQETGEFMAAANPPGSCHEPRTVLLGVDEADLGLTLAMLALGTLVAISEDVAAWDAGACLATPLFREPLEGMVPRAVLEVLGGMDEIGISLPVPQQENVTRRVKYIEELKGELVEAIRAMPSTSYSLGWRIKEELD